jgi:predicted O-linked N-acetylglucosamine transferase (SPINDLY family)
VSNAPDDLQTALQHHQAGRLPQAEQIYRQLLHANPMHADAWCFLGAVCQGQGKLDEAENNYRQALRLVPAYNSARNHLGVLLAQQGRLDEAADCFIQVLSLQPADADGYNNLGLVRAHQGRLEEAAAAYQRALQLRPDFPAARSNLDLLLQQQPQAGSQRVADQGLPPAANPAGAALLHTQQGLVLAQQGRLDDAKAQFLQALALDPGSVDVRNNLGCVAFLQRRYDEAVAYYEAVVHDAPEHVDAHSNLGAALLKQGHTEQAILHAREALRLRPDLAAAYTHLANALRESGQEQEADGYYEQALRLRPDDPSAQANQGAVLLRRGKIDDAAAHFRQALRLKPDFADAQNSLGNVYREQMQTPEAIACYRRALELAPHSTVLHSNLIHMLNFDPAYDAAALFAEHLQWARQRAEPLAAGVEPIEVDRTPDRRLRIGYVSPNFREQAINFFVEPILQSHDHAQFEFVCYSDAAHADATTERLRGYADGWHDTHRLTDEQLAQLIRQDQVDILVDLAGHTPQNRMLVFARKPAPVQVTYLGYQNTTGMSVMDYRLTDDYADPPGTTDEYYTEQLIRLPKSFFCYRPSPDSPPVTLLPATASGHITFGAFNNPAKITPEAIATWSQILSSVPESRLLLLVADSEGRNDYALEQFQQHGIDASRLEFVSRRPQPEYLALYQRVDIALDTFPFNGLTTTCDALWMGVPVVTLSGSTYASRFGACALIALKMKALVAQTPAQYVKIAVRLASEPKKLADVRAALRKRFADSSLVDAQGFTRSLEAAYRSMWRSFCRDA